MFGFGADDYFGFKYFCALIGAIFVIILILGYVIAYIIEVVSAKMKEKLLTKNGFKHKGTYWVGYRLSLHERDVQKMSYNKLRQKVIQ